MSPFFFLGGSPLKTLALAQGLPARWRKLFICPARKAYKSQTKVLGQQNIAALKLFEEIAKGKIVITPEILVTGTGADSGNLLNALIATILKPKKPSD